MFARLFFPFLLVAWTKTKWCQPPGLRKMTEPVEIIKLKHKKEARILNNMYIMSA